MEGTTIRKLRSRLGLTQAELGERLDVDQGTVSRWERGVECPRPARLARLKTLLKGDEESRHLKRSLALVRSDILPATLLDDELRLRESSAAAEQHYRDRGRDPTRLVGVEFERYANSIGNPELWDFVRQSGLPSGDVLLFRFSMNMYGMGHTTIWEPLLEDGQLVGVLAYAASYFSFPPNDEVSLERVDIVPVFGGSTLTELFRGSRAELVR